MFQFIELHPFAAAREKYLNDDEFTLQRNLTMAGGCHLSFSVRQIRAVISALNPLHQLNGHFYVELSQRQHRSQ